jgi:ribose transport system substrate-binding protein
VFSDFGDALAPALKAARNKDVTVVPWLIDLGDSDAYDAQVLDNTKDLGTQIADYFIEKLGGKGNVVAVSGAAGNSFDAEIDAALKERLESASDMNFLESAAADWDPAKAGPATATLLSKYEEIDAVFSSEATMIPPILDQFKNAGRDLPQLSSLDVNGVAGEMLELMPSNPSLGWGFFSARTWGVRQALTTALDISNGNPPANKTVYIENRIGDCSTQCEGLYDSSMPDTWIGTTEISKEVMRKLLG